MLNDFKKKYMKIMFGSSLFSVHKSVIESDILDSVSDIVKYYQFYDNVRSLD
jgi:hypothetical protein